MAGPTTIPFGDAKAVKRWSGQLFVDILSKSYWDRRFVSTKPNSPIQRLTELETGPGDVISFDLSVQLRNRPTYGDDLLEGSEEALRFYTDTVNIDQMRHGVSVGGRMTRKRTAHNLRTVGKDRLSEYWSKFVDEMHFIYLSGARGVNEDYTELLTWAGHAANAIQAPDAAHLMYASTAAAKTDITSAMVMTRNTIERACVTARMMRATDPTTANMMPILIDGGEHYAFVMSPFQEHSLRTASGSDWLDIQKAAASAQGNKNPIFRGGLGMIDNVVLHSHASVIRFSDYGSGANLPAARALFMGRQAGVIAYGSKNGLRFDWNEEMGDHKNLPKISAGVIAGVKKTRFNGKDFGMLSVDTYAAAP